MQEMITTPEESERKKSRKLMCTREQAFKVSSLLHFNLTYPLLLALVASSSCN